MRLLELARTVKKWDTITGTRCCLATPMIAPRPPSSYHPDPDLRALLAWRTQAASQQRRDKASKLQRNLFDGPDRGGGGSGHPRRSTRPRLITPRFTSCWFLEPSPWHLERLSQNSLWFLEVLPGWVLVLVLGSGGQKILYGFWNFWFWGGTKFPVWEKWFCGIPGLPGKAKKARRDPGRAFGARGEGGRSDGLASRGFSSKRPAGPFPLSEFGKHTHALSGLVVVAMGWWEKRERG